jgi:hypothetical protein
VLEGFVRHQFKTAAVLAHNIDMNRAMLSTRDSEEALYSLATDLHIHTKRPVCLGETKEI